MKLEDCTREELIFLLRYKALYNEERMELDVLLYRCNRCLKKQERLLEEESRASRRYVELMKPYEGRRIADIPDGVFRKARAALNEREQHLQAAEREERRWERMQKQIDKLLNGNV